jgi:hypothetical protein
MQELVRIVERLGYHIPAANIISAEYAKAEKLVSEFERRSKCPACDVILRPCSSLMIA